MPLPPASERELLHARTIESRGYRRSDGLWDIEAHLIDAKTYAFANRHRGEIKAGEPLHDMWLRVTVDDRFVVRAIAVVTDAGPYEVCPAVAPNFQRMTGVAMGPGWRREVRTRLGGVEGCTHLVETLGAMATVAFQTLAPLLARRSGNRLSSGRPPLLDSCHAYRSDGDIARTLWPTYYTGPEVPKDG